MDELDKFCIGLGVVLFWVVFMIVFFYGERFYKEKQHEKHMKYMEELHAR
tara:strand:- start:1573 stop:1722 length:150 start_codon:yes stop_codon:yes gene_type:complete